MTTIDKIRAEIKRLQDIFVETAKEMETEDEATVYSMCAVEFGDELLSFLDTLPDEPEQPTRGYDEAYLNEKIAKASKSWEGVDVDKFMDEIRGREPVTTCNQLGPVTDYHDLKKHTKEWVELMVGASFPEQDGDFISEEDYRSVIKKTALHFAEWGAEHLRDTTEKVSEDLEEAAENSWAVYEYREDPRGLYSSCYIDGFKEGAERQKAKMMEGAVVARVSIDELSCGLYNLCVEAGITSETDTTIIILPKED